MPQTAIPRSSPSQTSPTESFHSNANPPTPRHVHYVEDAQNYENYHEEPLDLSDVESHDPDRFLQEEEGLLYGHNGGMATHEYEDEDPPASLLFDPEERQQPRKGLGKLLAGQRIPTIGITPASPTYTPLESHRFIGNGRVIGRDKAMRSWDSIQDLDKFLSTVYTYFVGKGIWTMTLEKVSNLIILAFVVSFSVFLLNCVDYGRIKPGGTFSGIVQPQCLDTMHILPFSFLILFTIWWLGQIAYLVIQIPKLWDMYNFYTHVLEIPDVDMQSVSWATVVDRITKLPPPSNFVEEHLQLDALIIASRLMRRENYVIAIINEPGVLDLEVPGFGTVLTASLEWNLNYCVLGYLFDETGHLSHSVTSQIGLPTIRPADRDRLVVGFLLMGLLNLVFAPFIFGVVVMYFFFKYAEQIQKSPSLLTMRDYTRLADWKFREFNELPHYFYKRLNWSHLAAVAYMDGFPKEKTAIVAKLVTFISGAFAAMLAVVAWLDEDLLLNFEITPGRSGLFYIGLFGAILAVSRALTPDEYIIYDPRGMMEEVALDTHWLPDEWKEKLHADEVRREFSSFFQLRLVIFVQEVIGILVTPFLLMFRLPLNAENIVSFFLSNSGYADQVGWVCKYALFDLNQLDRDLETQSRLAPDKLSQSIMDFRHHHPEWNPVDQATSMYASQMYRFPPRPLARQRMRVMVRPKKRYQPAGRVVPLKEFEDSPMFDQAPPPQPRIIQEEVRVKPYGKIVNVFNRVLEPRTAL